MPGARDPKDVAREVVSIIEGFQTLDAIEEAQSRTEQELRDNPPAPPKELPISPDAATWRPTK